MLSISFSMEYIACHTVGDFIHTRSLTSCPQPRINNTLLLFPNIKWEEGRLLRSARSRSPALRLTCEIKSVGLEQR